MMKQSKGITLVALVITVIILIILAGTSFGLVEKIAYSEKGKKIGRVLKNILGTIIILVGLYLFYLGV